MADEAPTVLSASPDVDGPVYTGKQCKQEGCLNLLPAKGEPGFAGARRLCDVHFVGAKSHGKKPPADPGGGPSVSINLGGGAKGRSAEDKRVARVTNGATQMAQTVGLLIQLGGDQVCGGAVIARAQAWGKALGDLSRYQPALEKIFAPSGAATGQAFAWIAALAASAGIAIPIMAHHNLISAELAQKFAGGMATASVMTGAIDVEVPGDADQAAA